MAAYRRLWMGFALTVAAAALAVGCVSKTVLIVKPEQIPAATVGQPYSVEFMVENGGTSVGDINFEGELPPGLTFQFNQSTYRATLSGTPTQAGTYQFVVSSWLHPTMTTSGAGEREYTLIVNP